MTIQDCAGALLVEFDVIDGGVEAVVVGAEGLQDFQPCFGDGRGGK